MKRLSCSLLALAAAMALESQPISGYNISHTTISGVVVDSGYTFEVEPGGTVAELKEILAEQYQAPEDMFHVLRGDHETPDDFDLEQLGATNDLHLVFDFFLIKVVKPDGGYVILGGQMEETVASFKDKIAKRLNIPREMQQVMELSRELQDREKLAGNLIIDQAAYALSLVVKPGKVRVKCPSGEIITFEFEDFETVANLKDKIQQVKGIARNRQNLLLKGRGELKDDKLLVSLSLSERSTLTLVEPELDELDIIYVRLVSKRRLTFEVNLTRDTVASLKEKINRAEGLAQERQHLFLFKGKEMANARLLGDYVTESESVVDLLLCSDKQGAVGEHHLHSGPLGEDVSLNFFLNIQPNDTVASVKQAITIMNNKKCKGVGVRSQPPFTLHFISDNRELEDSKPMLEHVLNNGSLLQLMISLNDGPELIHVRLPSGKLITFELDMSSKVKELKDLIDQEVGRNKMSRKRLFYGNRELGDEKSLYDCKVRSGSTLNLILSKPGDK